MKDIKEFQKLFKVKFPIDEHHKYYIETLMKSEFYAGLGNIIKKFEEFEKYIDDKGYKSIKSYKMKKLDELVSFIKDTDAYKELLEIDFSNEKFRTKDEINNNDNTYLISIDFKSANYNSLKSLDYGALKNSWEELCYKFDIHKTLASSKSFRQIVFGNTNPRRLQRLQQKNILTIIRKLIEDHGFEEDDFVFISHDEFIIRLRPDHKLAVNRVLILNSAVGNIISNEGIKMPTHYKVFKNEVIHKDMMVQTHYNVKMGGLSELYTSLFKVPGNKFFKYFKTFILKEPLDRRDLMFMNDGEICMFSEYEDIIVKRFCIKGELTFEEVYKNYPKLINNLKENIPSLSDSQLRKIVNVILMCDC